MLRGEESKEMSAAMLRKLNAQVAILEADVAKRAASLIDREQVAIQNVAKRDAIRAAFAAMLVRIIPMIEGKDAPAIEAIMRCKIEDTFDELSRL